MRKLLFALLPLFFFTQCNSNKYSIENPSTQLIEMGKSGGFAATATTYYFYSNGQIIKSETFLGDTSKVIGEALEKQTRKEFKAMVKTIESMDSAPSESKVAGNVNYYIRLKTKNNDKKIAWSNTNKPPQAILDFYKNTLSSIQKTSN